METAILMDHTSLMLTSMELVTVSCVCYLVLLLMVESGLLLVDHQLTVVLIFIVMLCLHQLISVYILEEVLHHLKMVGTSVVYPLVVQILTLTSSLLTYTVSVLIVLVQFVICYWFTVGWVQIEDITVDLPSDITVLPQLYTLHAMTIRSISNYYLIDVSWYYESEQPTKLCSGQRYLKYSCSIGNGAVTVKGNGAHDYNLTIT